MAAPSLKKIAYHTLQQGKTLAGLAHKELSTKLMEVFAPEAAPGKFPVDQALIKEVRRSMEKLERIDWQGIVLDEAQAIKNPNAKQSQVTRDIAKKSKSNRTFF